MSAYGNPVHKRIIIFFMRETFACRWCDGIRGRLASGPIRHRPRITQSRSAGVIHEGDPFYSADLLAGTSGSPPTNPPVGETRGRHSAGYRDYTANEIGLSSIAREDGSVPIDPSGATWAHC